MRRSLTVVAALLALSVGAGTAMAQTITGQVTDNTGGILPGVTVEAASPALIEGSRIAFTDGAGRYTLIDLRPGVYNLTFSLPGFSTVLVEGQDLPADFTATVNAELSVGALEETVTVSGQAPLVDVQSTARAEVLDRELLDAIPTGNTLQSTAQLITGVKMNRPEVGLTTAAQQTYMSVHGMSPSQVTIQVDGQNMNSIGGDGAVQSYHNHLANQEMVYETSGMSAETSGGGVRINMVPREGGNTQSGQLWFGGSHDSLQRDGLESLSQDVQNRGVTSTEGISMMYDMNLVHGGPIVRDRLWYFGSVRNFQIDKKVTNSFWRFDPNGSVPNNWYFAAPRWFDPDPQRLDGTNGTERIPGIDENTISSGLLRLTFQASQNNKFSAHIDRVFKERYSNHDSNADIATAARHQGSPIYYTGSAKWTSTISSRLLLEAGYSTNVENWDQADPPGGVNALGRDFSQDRPAGWRPCYATPCFDNYGHAAQLSGPDEFNPTIDPWYGLVMRHDQSTGYRDRYHWGQEQWRVERFNYNIGLSYVTGSHNFKVGTNNSWGPYESYRTGNGDIERLMYRNGVPEFARVTNRPVISGIDYARDMGIFAQDTWTIDRLTLNLGLRWEQMIAHTYEAGPSVTPGPRSTITQDSRFVAAQAFASRRNLPNWKDFAPRLGLSYDVFGDASTALKVSWGRYNAANTFTYAQWFNPVSYQLENRNWVDCASLDGRACLTRADLLGMGLNPGIAFGASTANEHTIGPDGTVWNGGTNGDGFAQDWEIGSPRRANFGGLASRPVEHPDGVERNWVSVLNVGVQRELFEGFSASFNWYRRDTYDSVLRVNRALGFDDFTGFVMDNPCANDPNRGFLSCNQSGGLVPAQISVFNLNPESDGIADDWVVQNTPTGDDFSEVYNGFETGFNARLPNGSTIFGGWVMERNIFIRCDIPHDPNRLMFCDPRGRSDMVGGVPITQPAYSIPFLQEFKISGNFPLPGNFWISGSAQFYPAQEAVAGGSQDQWGGTHRGGELSGARPYSGNINYNVTPANVMDNLGIARTEGISVPLLPAGQLFYDRLTQVDLSVRRTFTLGNGMRVDLQADIYNIINYQPILNGTNTYGGSLGKASSTIQGRFVQFATNIRW